MPREIRVLVVASDREAAAALAAVLEEAHGALSVDPAATSAAALDRLSDAPVDCVLADDRLPDRDPLAFVSRLRERGSSLPIVVRAGATVDPGDALDAGATDVLEPECDDPAVIARRIENAAAATTAGDPGTGTASDDAGAHGDPAPDDASPPDGTPDGSTSGDATPGAATSDDAPEDATPGRATSDAATTGAPASDAATLEEYRSLVEEVGDPMYVLDADGYLRTVNHAMAEQVGLPREEIVGEHVSAFMPPTDVERGRDVIRDLLSNPDRRWATFEMRSVPEDRDATFHNETKIAALTDDGEFVGSVGVIRDISERKAYERELERQNRRLGEFASIVSHDLRNPLSVAEGRLELLREEIGETDGSTDGETDGGADGEAADGADAATADGTADGADDGANGSPDLAPDAAEEHLGEVDWALDRMRTLIDDLLALARQGDDIDELSVVDLDVAARECWGTVRTGDAELVVETDRAIEADEGRLRQLLENLFRNAVEHGGDVRVAVGGLPAGGFYVADDGPGVPAGEREDVFEYGYTTAEEGTGYGLPIVHEIATAHGWTVELTESEAGGARFEFRGVDVVGDGGSTEDGPGPDASGPSGAERLETSDR